MTNIQAIDLLKDLEQSLDDYCELNDEGKTAFRMAITALELFGISERLPSAQPGIIRCKDCKHYQFADNRAFGMPVKMCEWFGFEDVDDDDFCSRAERKEE